MKHLGGITKSRTKEKRASGRLLVPLLEAADGQEGTVGHYGDSVEPQRQEVNLNGVRNLGRHLKSS